MSRCLRLAPIRFQFEAGVRGKTRIGQVDGGGFKSATASGIDIENAIPNIKEVIYALERQMLPIEAAAPTARYVITFFKFEASR